MYIYKTYMDETYEDQNNSFGKISVHYPNLIHALTLNMIPTLTLSLTLTLNIPSILDLTLILTLN